jgi:hypothetical protein
MTDLTLPFKLHVNTAHCTIYLTTVQKVLFCLNTSLKFKKFYAPKRCVTASLHVIQLLIDAYWQLHESIRDCLYHQASLNCSSSSSAIHF